MFDWEWAGDVVRIILIDLVLSGDNAIIIGMAAHRLPDQQRRIAIWIGSGGAIVIRVALTAVAALLLQIPFLKLIGGALLLWIGFKLLKSEEAMEEGGKSSGSFREAIQTIIIADFIMSTDNILAVAAAAGDSFGLLIFGLVFSMAIMMVAGSAIAQWVDRFWWLAYVGSGVIAWTGAEMIVEDPLVHAQIGDVGVAYYPILLVVSIVTLGAAHYYYRYRPRRAHGGAAS